MKFKGNTGVAAANDCSADRSRVGVPDYRDLVKAKLRIANGLYESMVNEFHRALVFEAMVVAILMIEMSKLFQGQ